MLFAISTTGLNGQIVNGGFEDWYFVKDNIEYPKGWDQLILNADEAISRSNNAQEGVSSVSISSLNQVDGTYSPAYLGTKNKPLDYNLKFSFYYLLDSIEGQSNAVVEFYQQNSDGDYRIFKSVKYNEVSTFFIQEEIDLTLQSLDSLFIVLIAMNHPIFFGHDGFIRVLFDNVRLDAISSLHSIPSDVCRLNTVINDNTIYLTKGCSNFNSYILYSPLGQIISKGNISQNSIEIPINGMCFISLLSDSYDFQTFKVIGH